MWHKFNLRLARKMTTAQAGGTCAVIAWGNRDDWGGSPDQDNVKAQVFTQTLTKLATLVNFVTIVVARLFYTILQKSSLLKRKHRTFITLDVTLWATRPISLALL